MAMIKCPKCNEEISDKSEKCVHCGQILIEKPKVFCEECGTEIKGKEKTCSKCGCPVEKEDTTTPQKVEVTGVKIGNGISKKKIMTGIVMILLIAGAIFGIITYNQQKEKERKEQEAKELSEQYERDLSSISLKMLTGSVEAETCGNKIKKVWSNSIWKDSDEETDKYTKKNGVFNDDFNDSLSALFSDPDFIKITDSVEQNQNEINKLMKKMKNPPEEWKDAYSDLKDYYDLYLTFTNMCTDPTGSLTSYSNNFADYDSKVSNAYKKVQSYLDY